MLAQSHSKNEAFRAIYKKDIRTKKHTLTNEEVVRTDETDPKASALNGLSHTNHGTSPWRLIPSGDLEVSRQMKAATIYI